MYFGIKGEVYCRYDSYGQDNLLNMVLKFACSILINRVNDEEISRNIKKTLEAFDYARLIISNVTSKNSYGMDNAFSILFEMNVLFEEYVEILVSKVWSGKDKMATIQDRGKYFLTNVKSMRKNIALRHDIVLYEEDCAKIIIDTKWKNLWSHDRLSYNQGDIYQMYAYVNSYKGCERCIFVYPFVEDEGEYPIWKVSDEDNKFIEVSVVKIDSVINTVKCLENIIYMRSFQRNLISL